MGKFHKKFYHFPTDYSLSINFIGNVIIFNEIHSAGNNNFSCSAAKYVDWLSNIVPIIKKNDKVEVYMDFIKLNLAILKDEYAMPIADMLVDFAVSNGILTFMDDYSSHNQIFIAKEDVHKIAFRCTWAISIFEWVVMPFELKNVEASSQRTMNLIFHDLIGRTMEVYIHDIVFKLATFDQHLLNLEHAFKRMRLHGLKMNHEKCAFGITVGHFLGFLVHNKGIRVNKNITKAILEATPPKIN